MTRYFAVALCCLFFSTLLTARAATLDSTAVSPYRVIAYAGGGTDFFRIGAEKLTHINYAFGVVNPEGEIYFANPHAPAHLAQLQALKARNPALKIILSVGGWGADHFSDAVVDEAARQKFSQSALRLLNDYALDGIDLDWEYPGQPGPGIKFRPEDKQNFTLILQLMRHQLDSLSDLRQRSGVDRYTLTIASTNGEYFKHTEMDKLHVYLDWINIMTYDLFNSLTDQSGHHTGLYASAGAGIQHTDASVQEHLAAGIPPHKLVIGAAFYSREWTGIKNLKKGVNQPFEKYAGSHSYPQLLADFIGKQGYTRHWDATAQAPYLWNPDTHTLISYDDPESLKAKAAFVKKHQLGGIMYWEHALDPAETLLDAIVQGLR
ncbi:chitinase [Catalinimonas alkaloidigena]|uniref:chitinase n=1 Tax=Catalinimonas alkaloidigena TaxID=1075417 RepID=A0A1G9S5M9_9BACT|nr:glycoside hydrolase family 18 protein [Catalinimonas alkaloidigena]SDM30724.1 chitinase [Catalinimonas alkaloidigena]